MASKSLIRVDVAASIKSFRWEQANLHKLLASPEGAVGRDLVRRALRVETAAKHNATDRPGPRVQTGRLRGSITWRLGSDALGIYADVGSAVLYAPYVELGTSNMPAYPYLRPALSAAAI